MREFIATFGYGQKLQGCYCCVPAESRQEASDKMCKVYGNRWAFIYNSAEDAGIGRWNIREVPFGEPN